MPAIPIPEAVTARFFQAMPILVGCGNGIPDPTPDGVLAAMHSLMLTSTLIHPGDLAFRDGLARLAIRLIMRDYAPVPPPAEAPNGLLPLQDAIQRLEGQIQALRNEVGDRMGRLENGIQILQGSSNQAMALNINKARWSIGHQQLVTVPNNGHPVEENANVEALPPLQTFQDVVILGLGNVNRWLRYYNIYNTAHGMTLLEKKHLLINFLGGSAFGRLF